MDKKLRFLDNEEITALNELIEKVKKRYQVRKTILFGSKSRGDYSDYSDIDILFLTEKKLSAKALDDFFEISSSVNVEYGVAISCLVINIDDWQQNIDINISLKDNVEKEGVPIAV